MGEQLPLRFPIRIKSEVSGTEMLGTPLFNPELNWAILGNWVLFVLAVGFIFGTLRVRLNRMEARLDEFKHVLVQMATQKMEIDALNSRLSDIQRYGSHRSREIAAEIHKQVLEEIKSQIAELRREFERNYQPPRR